MVKHIVFWKLKEEAEGASAKENGLKIKAIAEALVGKVEGLLKLEVGFNYKEGDFDIALYSEFANVEAETAYQTHPDHMVLKAFVHKVICGRTAMDYEI